MTTTGKPNKPRPDFPLTAHPSGQWCKKVHGKVHYFGKWDDPMAALAAWEEQKGSLLAKREPRPVADSRVSLKRLCNLFLSARQKDVEAGELEGRSFHDLRYAITDFAKVIGSHVHVGQLGPNDFARYRDVLTNRPGRISDKLSPAAVTRMLSHVRALFNWGMSENVIPFVPMGTRFRRVKRRKARRHKVEVERTHGKKTLTPVQVRTLIDKAANPLKAMVLLGINCGFGQTDIADLHRSDIDLKAGVIENTRRKTEEQRKAPLWPETVNALREVIAAAGDRDLVFVTEKGHPMVREKIHHDDNGAIVKVTRIDRVGDMFDELMGGTDAKRHGVGFYSLRHTFSTIAAAVADEATRNVIMGHVGRESMGQNYVHEYPMDKLRQATDHVRDAVFTSQTRTPPTRRPAASRGGGAPASRGRRKAG